ncbi:hypothetical protein WY13_03381 [Clostridium ljungdahlii]|uniref:Uncharacterized protein n=1 Tax=Clostridium ljungdahlii TaxID=1538 RepID=A0A168LRE4_9CLOT|nr:hypothetical protein WY13_03381 [Clostridium ljungdahlii]
MKIKAAVVHENNFGGVMSDGTKRLSQNGQEISSFFGQYK